MGVGLVSFFFFFFLVLSTSANSSASTTATQSQDTALQPKRNCGFSRILTAGRPGETHLQALSACWRH